MKESVLAVPMKLFHHITLFFVSHKEKAALLDAGVEFQDVTRGSQGECATFEIGEGDARWGRVAALLASMKGTIGYRKSLG